MQSRKGSLIEAINNTALGFLISALTQQFVIHPLFNLETSAAQNLQITLIFTVISVARSYAVRRFHNWHQNKKNNSHDDETLDQGL